MIRSRSARHSYPVTLHRLELGCNCTAFALPTEPSQPGQHRWCHTHNGPATIRTSTPQPGYGGRRQRSAVDRVFGFESC